MMINQKYLKKESYARKFTDMFSDIFRISGKEVTYIAVLSALLTFFSTIACFGAEVIQSSHLVIQHYGFPFETIKKVFAFQSGSQSFRGHIIPVVIVGETIEIMWSGLVINLAIYALLSFAIVRVIIKVKEEIDLRRYDSIS